MNGRVGSIGEYRKAVSRQRASGYSRFGNPNAEVSVCRYTTGIDEETEAAENGAVRSCSLCGWRASQSGHAKACVQAHQLLFHGHCIGRLAGVIAGDGEDDATAV